MCVRSAQFAYHEKNVSTKKTKKEKKARIFKKNENRKRQRSDQKEKKQGKEKIKRLKMLPAKNRLIKKEDFQRVIRNGRLFSFGDIALRVLRNDLGKTRTGFLVGKKCARSAVRRNKIKRTLRGAFLQNLKEMHPGFDIVVFCRYRERKNREFKCTGTEVKKLLEKSKLLKKS